MAGNYNYAVPCTNVIVNVHNYDRVVADVRKLINN